MRRGSTSKIATAHTIHRIRLPGSRRGLEFGRGTNRVKRVLGARQPVVARAGERGNILIGLPPHPDVAVEETIRRGSTELSRCPATGVLFREKDCAAETIREVRRNTALPLIISHAPLGFSRGIYVKNLSKDMTVGCVGREPDGSRLVPGSVESRRGSFCRVARVRRAVVGLDARVVRADVSHIIRPWMPADVAGHVIVVLSRRIVDYGIVGVLPQVVLFDERQHVVERCAPGRTVGAGAVWGMEGVHPEGSGWIRPLDRRKLAEGILN